MPTCPNGHQSGSDDWCEVCGHRMAGAVPPPPPPPPPAAGYGYPPPGSPQPPGQGGRPHLSAVPDPAPEPELCPQCRTPREGGAPFCEECRWNFLTNTATSYTPAAPRPPGPGGGPGPGSGPGGPNPALRFQQQPPGQAGPGPVPNHGGYDYQGSRPSQMNRPAEPIPQYGEEPSGYPGDPSRQVPPPPGPGGNGPGMPGGYGGPGGQNGPGAPQGFQQAGPPAPPGYPQQTGHPQSPGGPSFGGGEDDWVISPPSTGAPGGPGGPPGPGGGQGGYGYPQPGSTQAPPGYQQQPLAWSITIGPDRDYFMAMMHRSGPEAAGLNLPAYSPEQQRPLIGNQLTIGRRRHSTGDTPDIDLSVPPEDPGVSHQHAVLVQQPDGGWAVVDQNSTNGTTVNGAEEPIQPFVPVPLQDGDRVHVGAWTTITIRRG
ncbi:FHA domain-containing protein [Streptomyces sp. 2A115]|uniref:FHA domain-containing protein n=1 Tax=Streptomyces sp. 2A115 TaxID=3457439 RepID=UPI003FD334A3